VWGALVRIDADRRVVLILHQLEGLSTKEIAEALDLGEEAVRSRLRRARTELETRLRRPPDERRTRPGAGPRGHECPRNTARSGPSRPPVGGVDGGAFGPDTSFFPFDPDAGDATFPFVPDSGLFDGSFPFFGDGGTAPPGRG